jgi:membrane-bound serine protease (ClpP class)
LLLGLYGFSIVPVNVVGAALIAAGLALVAAEVLVTSYGLLALGGITSFVLGSLMLVDSPIPELQIGPEVVVPVALVLAAVTALLATRAVRSRHLRARSGVEAMIGEPGEVVGAIAPDRDGRVFVHGETWSATSEEPIPEGAVVRVDALDGLRLRVSPQPTRDPGVRS